jgi:hypothetical protein
MPEMLGTYPKGGRGRPQRMPTSAHDRCCRKSDRRSTVKRNVYICPAGETLATSGRVNSDHAIRYFASVPRNALSPRSTRSTNPAIGRSFRRLVEESWQRRSFHTAWDNSCRPRCHRDHRKLAPGQVQPVAISNRRLVAADDGSVSFPWKDYRIEGPGRWVSGGLFSKPTFDDIIARRPICLWPPEPAYRAVLVSSSAHSEEET